MNKQQAVPRILSGVLNIKDKTKDLHISSVLTEAFCKKIECVVVPTCNDIIENCMSSLTEKNLFDLIILCGYKESSDCMQIDDLTAVKMIRCLKAYKTVPIISVDYKYLCHTYSKLGITAWIDPDAGYKNFVEAIQATMVYSSGGSPRLHQFFGSSWCLVS